MSQFDKNIEIGYKTRKELKLKESVVDQTIKNMGKNGMCIILDTNMIISGIFFGGKPRVL